ncbi:hypothetical protein Tco_1375112 [Tanacetum coccineum]
METSAIQQSAFVGESGLKPQNKLVKKTSSFNGGRFTMGRTVKNFVMQEMVSNLYPLKYKDLPSIEELRKFVAIFEQQARPSAVI